MQGVSASKGLEGPFRFSGGMPPAGAAPLGRAACRLLDLLASGPSRRFGSLSRSQIAPLSREPSLLVSSLEHIYLAICVLSFPR